MNIYGRVGDVLCSLNHELCMQAPIHINELLNFPTMVNTWNNELQ
jgi:hypothetical protein